MKENGTVVASIGTYTDGFFSLTISHYSNSYSSLLECGVL